MLKKVVTIGILLIFAHIFAYSAFAQRGINPDLQPKNIPGIPSTGRNCPIDQINKETGKCNDAEVMKACKSQKFDITTGLCLGAEDEPIVAFLQILAGALLMISGGLAVIVIGVGGVMYIVAHGDENLTTKAKNTIVYGILGSLVIIFSYFIVSVVLRIVLTQSIT